MSEIPTQEAKPGEGHELEAKLRQANLFGKKQSSNNKRLYIKCAVAREMVHSTERLL